LDDSSDGRPGAAPPGKLAGGAAFSRSGDLLYATCPECGQRIREPFHVDGGPQIYVHHRTRRGRDRLCRLIIAPAGRWVRSVPSDVSLEDALVEAVAG